MAFGTRTRVLRMAVEGKCERSDAHPGDFPSMRNEKDTSPADLATAGITHMRAGNTVACDLR